MAKSDDTAMFSIACGFTLAQFPIMLTLIGYYKDPLFSMYTANLLNITTKQMEIEVEDFSASILYTGASGIAALFAVASRRAKLSADTHYCMEVLDELKMWDGMFWIAVLAQHVCLVTFMCSPLDWYFLALTVTGIGLILMLMSRLPIVEGGRSRENVLMLLSALLFFMLYTMVRRHGHVGYFLGLLTMDSLVLIGHTYDSDPDMQTVGNCRLCYTSGMSVMMMFSYVQQ
jgi:hypothetical protein